VFDDKILALADELGLESHLADHAVDRLLGGLLLREKSDGYFDATPLAAWYAETYEPERWRQENVLRREILQAAAAAKAKHEWLSYAEGKERFINQPFPEVAAATRTLAEYGLVEMEERLGHAFHMQIIPEGFDLVRDESALTRSLPVSATEDDEAHTLVVPDVLSELIRSCAQLL